MSAGKWFKLKLLKEKRLNNNIQPVNHSFFFQFNGTFFRVSVVMASVHKISIVLDILLYILNDLT